MSSAVAQYYRHVFLNCDTGDLEIYDTLSSSYSYPIRREFLDREARAAHHRYTHLIHLDYASFKEIKRRLIYICPL